MNDQEGKRIEKEVSSSVSKTLEIKIKIGSPTNPDHVRSPSQKPSK
jgi:hypothetical protein